MLASGKWVNIGFGESVSCSESWYLEWNQLTSSSFFNACSVQRGFVLKMNKKSKVVMHVCSSVSSGILPRAKGLSIYGIIFHVFGVILKRKTLACGLQVRHIQITLWVNGSSESTSVTHFKPWHKASNM